MKTNWEDIKLKYITEDVSYKDLAGEFSLSERTIRTRAAKEKWSKERDEHKTNVRQKTKEKIAELRSEDYKRFMELASEAENEVVEKALNYIKLADKDEQALRWYLRERIRRLSRAQYQQWRRYTTQTTTRR